MKKLLTATAGLGLLLVGCSTERQLNSYNENVEYFDESEFASYGNLTTSSARMRGDIGTMRNIDNEADIQGYDDGDYTTLEIVTSDNRGAAMHWVEVYGGLNHPALQPGNNLSFQGGNIPSNAGEIHVEAMACQGDQIYAWDYDEPANRVDVAVRDVEGRDDVVQVDYTTYVPNQNLGFGAEAVSSGSFLVER